MLNIDMFSLLFSQDNIDDFKSHSHDVVFVEVCYRLPKMQNTNNNMLLRMIKISFCHVIVVLLWNSNSGQIIKVFQKRMQNNQNLLGVA